MTETIRDFRPGPSYVLESVRQAMTAPMVGHRSRSFRALYGRLANALPAIFRTELDVMIATASSTLLMEASLRSTAKQHSLHLTNGAFSERWLDVALSLGLEADRVAYPWGAAVDPGLLRSALARRRYEVVTVVHCETSTGVLSPLEEIARVVREESDALLLVDAVSSLGGAQVEVDAWGLDVVLVGSQKALAVPPGLVLFTLSERAARQAARIEHRGFYTDLLRYREKHEAGGTITTPALPQFHALDRQCERILHEGIQNRWLRHRRMADRTARWAIEWGFELASTAGRQSPTVTCLRPPKGRSAMGLVSALEEKGWTLATGYGAWKASTLRIGHMGEVRESDLEGLLDAITAEMETAS